MRSSLAMAISAASAGLSPPDMKTQFFPSAFSSRTCFSNALLHSLSTPTTSGIGISRALQKHQPFPSLQKSWDPFCLQCDFTLKRPQILKLGKPFTVACVLGEDAAEQQMQNCKDRFKEHSILFSNLVAKKERPYFVNREWSSKDIGYVSFLGGMHLLCLLAPFTFSWGAFSCFLLLYAITGLLGITLSYHRNLSHKSFKLPKWLEYTFAYCGAQAMQGDPIEWVSAHRYHHQYCDTALDPHTPLEGFWHSHMGWLLDDKATSDRVGARNNISDMATDPFYKFIQRTYLLHPILLGVALYSIGGFPYIIWGMAVRAVWVYHITWAVNSAAHVWGTQEWNTGDLSRNNWWVALLAFGEGWHNNHHAFEYSARHGLEWWQLDPTWYMICLLQAIGLATKVKLPSKEHKLRLAFDHT